VTTIGESAFAYCSGLSSLAIGNGVTTIGRDAFKDCTNITKVELDNNAIVSKDYDGTPYISDIFGEQVKEYVFGEHVTRIGENAFSHYNLTSVTIPASVTNIGYCAFYQCFYLTDIHITDIAAWCRIQRESSSNGYYMNPFQVPYHLYLNDDENELLENKYRLSKAKSKSQFVRDLIVDGYIFDVDFSELTRYNFLLSKISTNINQIAHRANETQIIYQADINSLREEMNKLWQLQRSMLSNLPWAKQ
jgi:hypothetical protein